MNTIFRILSICRTSERTLDESIPAKIDERSIVELMKSPVHLRHASMRAADVRMNQVFVAVQLSTIARLR
jgi:hypothetical protein